MSKFDSFIETASSLITSNGAQGKYKSITVIADENKPWNSGTEVENVNPITYISFPNDGITFPQYNVASEGRILMCVPSAAIQLAIGDTIETARGENVSVMDFKRLNPDDSVDEDILWQILVK